MTARIGFIALSLLLVLALEGDAQEVSIEGEAGEDEAEFGAGMPVRAFSRFPLESATQTGFWAEAGTLYLNEDDAGAELDFIGSFLRVAYGAKKWEAGLEIPYLNAQVDDPFSGDSSESGLGDMQVYAKFVPIRSAVVDFGAGGLLSLPMGDEEAGFGTGEVGMLPFVTGAIHVGPIQTRAHVGWEFFSGSENETPDLLVYGFGLHTPLGSHAALRAEFAGTRIDTRDKPTLMEALPGLDFRIPVGSIDALIRATGSIGITEDASDWGIGGSMVLVRSQSSN